MGVAPSLEVQTLTRAQSAVGLANEVDISMIGEWERANLVLGLGIGTRATRKRKTNSSQALSERTVRETERTSLLISGNDMTTPHKERARDQESEEA